MRNKASSQPTTEAASTRSTLEREKGFPHMNLAEDKLSQLENPALTPDKRALLRCRFAAKLLHTGKFGAAGEALGEFWPGTGKRPDVGGLSLYAAIFMIRWWQRNSHGYSLSLPAGTVREWFEVLWWRSGKSGWWVSVHGTFFSILLKASSGSPERR